MKRAILLAALTLASCGKPHIETRYVQTFCVTREQYEQLKRSQPERIHDRLTGDAEKDILTITANAIRLRAHDDGLLEVLGGCVKPDRPDASALADRLLSE